MRRRRTPSRASKPLYYSSSSSSGGAGAVAATGAVDATGGFVSAVVAGLTASTRAEAGRALLGPGDGAKDLASPDLASLDLASADLGSPGLASPACCPRRASLAGSGRLVARGSLRREER